MRKKQLFQFGSALVELALVTPLFLGLVCAGLEFTRTLKSYQLMSSLSQTTADTAYRDCAYQTNPQVCLNSVIANTMPYIATNIPGAEVVLSVYNYDGTTVNLVGIAGVDQTTLQTPSGNQSHFDAATLLTRLTSISSVNNRVSISEVYFPQTLIMSLFQSIFSHNPGILYEATIY